MTADEKYAQVLRHLLGEGERVETRNAPVRRTFLWSCRFDSTPLIGLRRTAWKNALREWEWFMSGSDNINDLHPSVQHWWRPWASPKGRVRYNYSQQFRFFWGHGGAVDQVERLVDGVRDHPYSRRNVMTTWNAQEMAASDCPITNCHGTVIQAFVDARGRLHLKAYQRSMDVICGLPHNWVQYWAFLVWLAHATGRGVGCLCWEGGDVHLYEEHAGLAERMLLLSPPPSPELVYRSSGETFVADDFALSGSYTPALMERARMIV